MDDRDDGQIAGTSRGKSTKSDKNKDSLSKREAAKRDKRLEFLLKQTEKFSDFIQVSAENKKVRQSRWKGRKKSDKSQPKRAIIEDSESDDEELNQKFHEFKKSPPYINGEMRDYQIRGLNWLVKLYENGINGILADEMGLGKTLQSISLLGYLRHHKNVKGKHLVFCPKSTVFNWIKEFNRWCPEIRAVAYVGTKEERDEIEKTKIKPQKFDVLVTNYEMMLNESSVLKKIAWHFLIVDEGHRLKNENSSFSKLTRQLQTSHRLILTGTPLQNNLHELWALLNFLLPDIFSSSDDFDSWFDTTTVLSSGDTLVTRLHTILKPFFLRRIKSDVEKSLLPKIEYKLYTGITSLQRELYIKTLKKEFEYFNPSTCRSYEVHEPSQILMNLKKICNHPYMLPGVEPEPFVTDEKLVQVCGKMQLLDKLLAMLKEQGSKVLIFAQFKHLLSILEDYFDLRGYKYCRLDGETTFEERIEYMEDFNRKDSDKFIFLLSTRAGGLGINLTAADTVIIYDSDWNPQVDIQAEDRAHRIGQTKQVKVFRLISEKTIDERIIQRAAIKLQLDQKVIQEGRLLDSAKIGKNEMKGMIYYDMEEIMKSTESTITDESIQEIMKRSQEKSKKLEKQVKNSEINFENFETIFKFDGENYVTAPNFDEFAEPSTSRRRTVKDIGIEKSKLMMTLQPKPEPKIVKPLPDVSEYPKIYEFQFYDPKLLDLMKKQFFWYLKKNKKLTPLKFQESVNSATELTEKETAQARKFLKDGFDWTKDEFKIYLNWAKENGNKRIRSQIVATRSMTEIRKYHRVFWNRFLELKDPKVRLDCYRGLCRRWELTVTKIYQHCENEIQNLSNIGCKFMTSVGCNKYAVAYIVKKLDLEGTDNPNLFEEMAETLKLIENCISCPNINREINGQIEAQSMIILIQIILNSLSLNIDKFSKASGVLGKIHVGTNSYHFEDLEKRRRQMQKMDENHNTLNEESICFEKSEASEDSVKTKITEESGKSSTGFGNLPTKSIEAKGKSVKSSKATDVETLGTEKVNADALEISRVRKRASSPTSNNPKRRKLDSENSPTLGTEKVKVDALEVSRNKSSFRKRTSTPPSHTPKRRKLDNENSPNLDQSFSSSTKTENSSKIVLPDEFKRRVLKVRLENIDVASSPRKSDS